MAKLNSTMSIKDYFKVNKSDKGLLSVEIVMIIYMVFTGLLTLFYGHKLEHFDSLLIKRAIVLGSIFIGYRIWKYYPCRALVVIRYTAVMLCLIFLYSETYDFASQLPYKDHIFASIDWKLFGYQPSLEFCKSMTNLFWSEALYLGYYSYYYIMILTMLCFAFWRYELSNKASFIFLSSFFLYYVIYEFLPVAGPYYYFQAIGIDTANSGVYPDLGYYFQTHNEMLPSESRGVFSHLVHGLHETDEYPTAAFPSSHVGMGTVSMMLLWRGKFKWMFFIILPLYLLLCVATVYIQAHYFIDTIAGFVAAIALYYFTKWLYEVTLEKRVCR